VDSRRWQALGHYSTTWGLLAGWTHYLPFDLVHRWWEARDAQRRGVPHLLVVPALVLTFLLGPAGLLLYLGIRAIASRKTVLATENPE